MILGIFRNRLREGAREAYAPVAVRMAELAQAAPGFVSMKTFAAADGERVTVFTFDDLASVDAWRAHAEHREAQRLGRTDFYTHYELVIAEVVRTSAFAAVAGSGQGGG